MDSPANPKDIYKYPKHAKKKTRGKARTSLCSSNKGKCCFHGDILVFSKISVIENVEVGKIEYCLYTENGEKDSKIKGSYIKIPGTDGHFTKLRDNVDFQALYDTDFNKDKSDPNQFNPFQRLN